VSTQSGFTVRHLVPAVAVASLALSLPAGAAKFDLGPFEATFTSRLSVGASWRVEDTDNAFVSPGNTQGFGRASSSTADDGNLNYGQGDMYSLLFKGVHDLDLNAGNWGFFTRVKYWYDYAQANDTVPHGHAATNYTPNDHLDMSRFEPLARDQGFQFLDYYLYGDFDIGNKPLELRAGNMVLNWGENLFIQNGVSVIAPFDVTALRRPGSEIREALLPVGMVYANFGATDNLSLEAFYQYDWDRAILDECGTYWNAADPYGGGCDYLTVSAADPDASQVGTTVINRGGDVEPEDSGQFGISARYFAESLNSTEFGFYYLNVHNRTPIFSGINTEEGLGGNILNPAVQPKFFFRLHRGYRDLRRQFHHQPGVLGLGRRTVLQAGVSPADQHHGLPAGAVPGLPRRVVADSRTLAGSGGRRRHQWLRRGRVHAVPDLIHPFLRAGLGCRSHLRGRGNRCHLDRRHGPERQLRALADLRCGEFRALRIRRVPGCGSNLQ
jgi:hypothetical protein